jgi:hypothetical protein
VDCEFLDWVSGEGEEIKVNGIPNGYNSERDDFLNRSIRNELFEPMKYGSTPKAKIAKVCHVLQSVPKFSFMPFHVNVARYHERANPSGKVG